MLRYCKMILEKMTIDKQLFTKELKKAYKMLSPVEAIELYYYCKQRFPTFTTEQPVYMLPS